MVKAPAKVNLYLHVTGRRPDGYHLLDSLVVFTSFGDEISVSPAMTGAGLNLTVDGPFANRLGPAGDNLVMQAARLLGAHYPAVTRDVTLHLTKRLPVAAGVGGGSSDAAATLKALVEYREPDMTEQGLMALGAQLGTDVPACLYGKPVLVRGTGETLKPVPGLPRLSLVLVNPGTPLSTPEVFETFALGGTVPGASLDALPPSPVEKPALSVGEFIAVLQEHRNDLTDAAMERVPGIAVVLDTLDAQPQCLLARMSGSGATCFGLFADSRHAAAARDAIRHDRPGWWVESTDLL